MRDLLIGLGYFAFTLLMALIGLGLLINPRKYHVVLTKGLLDIRKRSSRLDWSSRDAQYWRQVGTVVLTLGLIMFSRPIISAYSHHDSTLPVAPSAHQTQSHDLTSIIIVPILFGVGILLVWNPAKALAFFGHKPPEQEDLTTVALIPIRVIGGLFIMGSLFILVRFILPSLLSQTPLRAH